MQTGVTINTAVRRAAADAVVQFILLMGLTCRALKLDVVYILLTCYDSLRQCCS